MKKILIIGGYGDVGSHVVEKLISITTSRIIIGGRNKSKASNFIQSQNNQRLEYMYIDIYNKVSYMEKLENIEIAIMCLSPKNNTFAEYCLKNKIHYIDISPSNQMTNELLKMDYTCKRNHTVCILGVGISPGLSTLLVDDMSKQFDRIESTSISLMLGMGDEYGKDSLQWLLLNLSNPFACFQNGAMTYKRPFIKRKKAKFDSPLGKHSAFEFNLADQQIITNTLSIRNVSTYFCYDSRFSTWLVHLLAKFGVFKLLKYSISSKIIAFLVNMTLKLAKPFTSNMFAINVEITGFQHGVFIKKTGNIKGNNSAKVTGEVVA